MRNSSRKTWMILAATSGLGLSHFASAANVTWASAPGSSFWNAANWTPTQPVAGDALFFGTSSVTSLNNDYPTDTTFSGLTFNSGASAFTIGGNEIVLGTPNTGVPAIGVITNSSSNLQT